MAALLLGVERQSMRGPLTSRWILPSCLDG